MCEEFDQRSSTSRQATDQQVTRLLNCRIRDVPLLMSYTTVRLHY